MPGADHPGLHPQLAWPVLLHDHLGIARPDRVGCASGIAHHPGTSGECRAGGQYTGAAVLRSNRRARRRRRGCTCPSRESVRRAPRERPPLPGHGYAAGGRCGPRPMSTRRIEPACSAPRPTTRPGFSTPNVTVTSARTAAPVTAPVSASTPEGRSTATVGKSATAAASSAASGRRPPRPPIPEDAVHDQVALGRWRRPTRPPARRRAARPSGMRLVRRQQHRGHQRPAPGKRRARVQRVAAVVTRTDEQRDACAVHRTEQRRAVHGKPGSRALHQRAAARFAPSARPRLPAPPRQ